MWRQCLVLLISNLLGGQVRGGNLLLLTCASGLLLRCVCVNHLGQGFYFIGDYYSNEKLRRFVERRWLTWSGLFEKFYDEILRSCCSIIVPSLRLSEWKFVCGDWHIVNGNLMWSESSFAEGKLRDCLWWKVRKLCDFLLFVSSLLNRWMDQKKRNVEIKWHQLSWVNRGNNKIMIRQRNYCHLMMSGGKRGTELIELFVSSVSGEE